MADFISHSLFADTLLDDDRPFPGKDACRAYPNLFRLGAQGPDLLYYCDYVSPGRHLKPVGDALHAIPAEAVVQALRETSPDNDAPAVAYARGYSAHLCLDNHVHPFICAEQDVVAEALGCSGQCAHVLLESEIEVRELSESRGIPPRRFPWRRDMPANRQQAAIAVRLNAALARACGAMKGTVPLTVGAVQRLPLLFSLLFEPTGALRSLLDLPVALTKRDCALRHHFRHSYRPERFARVVGESRWQQYRALAVQAFRAYPEQI